MSVTVQDIFLRWAARLFDAGEIYTGVGFEDLSDQSAKPFVSIGIPSMSWDPVQMGAVGAGMGVTVVDRYDTNWAIPIFVGSGRYAKSPQVAYQICEGIIQKLYDALTSDPPQVNGWVGPSHTDVWKPFEMDKQSIVLRLNLELNVPGGFK